MRYVCEIWLIVLNLLKEDGARLVRVDTQNVSRLLNVLGKLRTVPTHTSHDILSHVALISTRVCGNYGTVVRFVTLHRRGVPLVEPLQHSVWLIASIRVVRIAELSNGTIRVTRIGVDVKLDDRRGAAARGTPVIHLVGVRLIHKEPARLVHAERGRPVWFSRVSHRANHNDRFL